MATKMGFEGKIYYGAGGATGTTEIGNSRDIQYNLDVDRGDTTVRGTAGTPPIKTSRVVAFGVSIEWTMLVKTDDTTLESLRTAAAAGTAVAIRTKDYAAGKGFDGDCELSVKHGKPLGGEQTLVFTAEPTDEVRAVSLYV
jgi:hypothetical protein